jgi:hypothetical protein
MIQYRIITGMARAWILTICLLACALACKGEDSEVANIFEEDGANGTAIAFFGRSMKFAIRPNKTSSEYVRLEFAKLLELDSNGRPVQRRTIQSLASVKNAEFTTGGLCGCDGLSCPGVMSACSMACLCMHAHSCLAQPVMRAQLQACHAPPLTSCLLPLACCSLLPGTGVFLGANGSAGVNCTYVKVSVSLSDAPSLGACPGAPGKCAASVQAALQLGSLVLAVALPLG